MQNILRPCVKRLLDSAEIFSIISDKELWNIIHGLLYIFEPIEMTRFEIFLQRNWWMDTGTLACTLCSYFLKIQFQKNSLTDVGDNGKSITQCAANVVLLFKVSIKEVALYSVWTLQEQRSATLDCHAKMTLFVTASSCVVMMTWITVSSKELMTRNAVIALLRYISGKCLACL